MRRWKDVVFRCFCRTADSGVQVMQVCPPYGGCSPYGELVCERVGAGWLIENDIPFYSTEISYSKLKCYPLSDDCKETKREACRSEE